MNYFILPKFNNYIIIKLNTNKNNIETYLSNSFIYFSINIDTQLQILNYEIIEDIKKNNLFHNYQDYNIYNFINPYHYLTNEIIKINFNLTKYEYKIVDNHIFILQEIINSLKLFDNFNNNQITIGIYNISINDILHLFKLIYNDLNFNFIHFDNLIEPNIFTKYHNKETLLNNNIYFLFYKINNFIQEKENYNNYIFRLIKILYHILTFFSVQSMNESGNIILNIDNLTMKPNIEFVYILCHLFEKVIIINPLISNVFTNDCFIFGKGFLNNNNSKNLLFTLKKIIDTWNSNLLNIHSIINNDLPLFFLNKIEELNIIIGQQKLELIYQNINILKSNKNKIEKINIIKKNNISKCLKWFIKNKIPILEVCKSAFSS
jgi:hypothetical protein